MKRYFSFVEAQPPAKVKINNVNLLVKLHQVKSQTHQNHLVKRCKNRSNPDPKWMDNGNDAYRNVDGTLFMFYTNKNQNYNANAVHIFHGKKYLALSVYPDLYQLIDFHRKNSDVMKLYNNTPEALQLPSLLIKDSPSELNDYGSHLSNTSAKEIEVAIEWLIWNYIKFEDFIIAKGLKLENLLHFWSDGAATLIGTKTGVVKRFEKINPFYYICALFFSTYAKFKDDIGDVRRTDVLLFLD
ncbi:hypothetical protein GLOIN_2v1762765 [Rhizophagus irregularis DAOM 181602=DAOM 197198]|uniref:Uncharacterized protein n=1 Tax=Rhizophagus irregularis (strain DAOM 181602 / DAOM 197198 / MUCL 43194) TaxID=747089 RepID=A0A2P4QWF9_RHIID|nr:hypothetical protein GLOIN_2v1762765 [Rhizophagus irregularis DAOM 181602=DAOM 197198]POG81878.1 hypothetical protein GLOIN_2v1762765 [Rhizophagus irregularis DAOM 181602=DAOM 197198]|eukprot:XP_025188744.1 hypothetical protein GLOIN_2v1762765 [Rhizophagus irregularis DAOM 181602=DAOM 197198]